jgi:hypothetical protein
MKTYVEGGGIAVRILNPAMDEGEWSASRPGRFTVEKRVPGTNFIGDWVGFIAGPDAVKRKYSFLASVGI